MSGRLARAASLVLAIAVLAAAGCQQSGGGAGGEKPFRVGECVEGSGKVVYSDER